MPQIENMVDKLETRLPENGRRLLDALRANAEAAGVRAFLVGGTVRDLLLGRDSLDVDIVIEGDAVALARTVAQTTGARLAKTTTFGTATLKLDAFSLDLATARTETYARPGALPTVRPATLDEDLHRRDFTINAIAIQITEPAQGKMFDPTGGADDLRRGLLRVLHDRSFQDDATRIIRAVRYATRFEVALEERTADLLRRDLPYLDRISGTRIRQELARVFAESEPEKTLAAMQELGVLRAIHPALSFRDEQRAATIRLRELHGLALAMWPLLAWNSARSDDLIRRLALTRAQSSAVEAVPRAQTVATDLPSRPSAITHALEPLQLATTYALAAMTNDERIASYVTRWRAVKPILRGDDVIDIGVPRGPDVAEVLAQLRAAKLDGEVTSRAAEVHLIEQFLARERIGLA